MSKPAPRDLLAKLFRGFGDPSRLSILLRLREGPLCVSEVVDATGLSQPNASMHLACLWECGLVERDPRGRSVYYRIASASVTQLLGLAEAVLAASGGRIECCPRYRRTRSEEPSGRRRARPATGDRTRVRRPPPNLGVK
jgi:DNA-binding transcriptional ArsR family regulator